jgi:hypothetical protein
MLKNIGTVRLIDKSLPPNNLMSHCKPALETEVSWNQQGQQGAVGPQGIQGPQGLAGTNGTNGMDGAPGTPGADGKDGINGTDGAPGAPGANGEDGLPGTNGADGQPGAQGPPGDQGLPGPPGSAAQFTARTFGGGIAPNSVGEVDVYCPAGFVATGGGFSLPNDGSASDVTVFESTEIGTPSGSGWRARGRNSSAVSRSMYVSVNCAK